MSNIHRNSSESRKFFQELDDPYLDYKEENDQFIWYTSGFVVQQQLVLPIPVTIPGSIISFNFETKDGDIAFGINFNAEENDDVESVVDLTRVQSDEEIIAGKFEVPRKGTVNFIWDNSYSWFNAKTLSYTLELHQEPGMDYMDNNRASMARLMLHEVSHEIATNKAIFSIDKGNLEKLTNEISVLQNELDLLNAKLNKKKKEAEEYHQMAAEALHEIEICEDSKLGLLMRCINRKSLRNIFEYLTPDPPVALVCKYWKALHNNKKFVHQQQQQQLQPSELAPASNGPRKTLDFTRTSNTSTSANDHEANNNNNSNNNNSNNAVEDISNDSTTMTDTSAGHIDDLDTDISHLINPLTLDVLNESSEHGSSSSSTVGSPRSSTGNTSNKLNGSTNELDGDEEPVIMRWRQRKKVMRFNELKREVVTLINALQSMEGKVKELRETKKKQEQKITAWVAGFQKSHRRAPTEEDTERLAGSLFEDYRTTEISLNKILPKFVHLRELFTVKQDELEKARFAVQSLSVQPFIA